MQVAQKNQYSLAKDKCSTLLACSKDYCMAHRSCIHDFVYLGNNYNIENLIQNHHTYFFHSPKRHLELIRLTNMMETKGLKMLKNVKTQWISFLYLLWIILSKYMPLLAKMFMDSSSNQSTKIPCCLPFSTIIDLYVVAIFLSYKVWLHLFQS